MILICIWRKQLSYKIDKLIDRHILDQYNVIDILTIKDSSKLLTYNRLDIAIKLLYLDVMFKNKLKDDVYSRHIKIITNGTCVENGNLNKNSINTFKKKFIEIYESILKNGYQSSVSLIPVSSNGSIINGAHRVAVCIKLDVKDVICVKLDTPDYIYDYKYFIKSGMPVCDIEKSLIKFVEYTDNTYIAFLWPASEDKHDKIKLLFNKTVYEKDISLSSNGAQNLIRILYKNQEWSKINSKVISRGISIKTKHCFPKYKGAIKIVIFQADSIKEVQKVKENIRIFSGIGKHSIHTTDNKTETLDICNIILNPNGMHLLEHMNPKYFEKSIAELENLKRILDNNNIDLKKILIVSGFVLQLYGLRISGDLDYIGDIAHPEKLEAYNINSHNNYMQYYDGNVEELINEDEIYFILFGLKILAFKKLYEMKTHRAELKDNIDCGLMNSLISNRGFEFNFNKLVSKILYILFLLKCKLIRMLVSAGLSKPLKKLLSYFI